MATMMTMIRDEAGDGDSVNEGGSGGGSDNDFQH